MKPGTLMYHSQYEWLLYHINSGQLHILSRIHNFFFFFLKHKKKQQQKSHNVQVLTIFPHDLG